MVNIGVVKYILVIKPEPTISVLKNLEFSQTCLFYYRKEDLIPRGCNFRSFRMENKVFFVKHLQIFE